MSISGAQLVQDVLSEVGAYGVGDNLDNADAQLVLRAINRMVDSWANENHMLYEHFIDSLTMVAGTASYASTLLASALRPVSVESWYVSLDGVDYPGEIITREEYNNISVKSVTGVPRLMALTARTNTQTMSFYPAPDAAYGLRLTVRLPLAATPITIATTVILPIGYEQALVKNAAVQVAPSFGRVPSPLLLQQATEARRVLKRMNYEPVLLASEMSTSRGNIITDGL